ncbi:lactonase family protein [Candidatus Poribacteria bacterium]|jgi:6-phosphogluconolactonase|nr:lactonase family protein [Candidatus Poribacteria bacterium]MBT5535023.1 lactonase family protein [Candidatus Poribacteria bacterium]MBT5713894.1 lactonase family protein [Candidatus Poribacteria bacterium]MBT7097724.1 lactonase family protein [Candidatus Poribacteria bacterium]MBT7808479.1 lactonase family protein [Candidatus Poribacteria bacterium]
MIERNGSGFLAYIGTYADADSDGIHIYGFDATSGALERLGGASGVANPSYVAISPDRSCLYAACEIADFGGAKAGGVAAFSIDSATGALTQINQQSSVGTGPCHLTVDATGSYVLVANYGGGSVTMLPINDDGALAEASDFHQHEGSSVNPNRQKEPHGHSINVDPGNRYAYACDLGLDQVLIYALDLENGKLVPNDPPYGSTPDGAGPRHLAFHPTGSHAYVINELDSTMTVFAVDADTGGLTETQTITTLPDDFDGVSHCADVHVSPDGRYVYGSNRGDDSIAIYSISDDGGSIEALGHESTKGETPRGFAVDPTGGFLLAANQSTDDIHTFRISADDGSLSATGHSVEVSKPVCVKVMPMSS